LLCSLCSVSICIDCAIVAPQAGETPLNIQMHEKLMTAAKDGDVAAARAALDSGVDKEREDKMVRGRRRQGVLHRHATAVRMLIVMRRVQSGITPLSLAAENGHLGVVQLLVERGADMNTKVVVRFAVPAAARAARA
jgi:ankyrin repeat protein